MKSSNLGKQVGRRGFLAIGASAVAATSIAAPVAASNSSGTGNGAGQLPAPPRFIPQAQLPSADLSEYERHLELARIAIAGRTDVHSPNWALNPGSRPPELSDATVLPATQLFDQLWYIGMVKWGQYALRTTDGSVVLFDSLGSEDEARAITLPGLEAIGLSHAQVKAIMITHGHSDHDGGASFLGKYYENANIWMGAPDYNSQKGYTAQLFRAAASTPIPLEVGGSPLTAVLTPGHTDGTTSFILPVTHRGATHKVAYWGGSGMGNPTAAQAEQYMRSAADFYYLIRKHNVDASINSHTFFDHSDARIAEIIRSGGGGDTNPMIQGTEVVARSFAVLRQSACAVLASKDTSALNPGWFVTDLDIYASNVVNVRSSSAKGKMVVAVAARLANAFEVLPGRVVNFSTPSGDQVTALTDEGGIARCVLQLSGDEKPKSITAQFEGFAASTGRDLDLPSTKTVPI